MSASGTLIFDLDDDLPGVLSWIEDRFRWTDADDEHTASALHAGATAAARLAQVVRDAQVRAPMLLSPTGHELAPVGLTARSIGDLVVALRAAIARAPRRLLHDEQHHALDLLERCAARSGEPVAVILHDLLASHLQQKVMLHDTQWSAYRCFAHAVLVDPLDRFVAGTDFTPPFEATCSAISPSSNGLLR